jgi:hypothetical protein
MVEFKQFLDILDEMTEEDVYYFKPTTKPPLNAYHPLIKRQLFKLTLAPEGKFNMKYLTLMDEVPLDKTVLKKMFHDRKWLNYELFDLVEDYYKWQEYLVAHGKPRL